MNSRELIEEINKDYINAFLTAETKNNKVRRIILKSGVFPVRLHKWVNTKRKNKWLILWTAESRKNIGDLSVVVFICTWQSDHGRYALMPTTAQEKPLFLMFAPHFFSRYAERQNLDETGDDLIKRYFEINYNYGFSSGIKYISENSAENEIFGSSEEGIAMGVKSITEELVLFRTFINYEMCKGEQTEIFAKSNKLREEIHKSEMKNY